VTDCIQASICFLCIIYTYLRIPEPQGRSFAELDLLFERHVSARKFADVELVANLVDSCLESPRTIILAVIQATNDIANQKMIQRARKFSGAGQRTVGIITKADLINKNTEPRIVLLAKNKDTTRLKLGYFLLKNPTPSQLNAGISLDERKRDEYQFFCSSAWKDQQLDMSRVGIEALRTFVQELLEQHIERELPKVRAEIKKLLLQMESEIADLGD
jgi:hypothetical protein